MIEFVPADHLQEFVQSVFPTRKILMRSLKGGLLNQNLFVRVGDERFVMKAYRPKVTADAMKEMHRMMAHADRHGIPVALPIAEGERDGHMIGIYPFIEGKNPPRYGNRAGMKPMGEMHGRVIEALQSFRSHVPKPLFDEVARWDPESFLGEIASMRKQLRGKPRIVQETIGRSLDIHESIMQMGGWDREQFMKLPMRISHNDFHMGNVLMEGKRVTSVLDWEKAGWEWRGYEVMRSVTFVCRKRPDALDWDQVKAYLQAYRKHVSLTALERELAFEAALHKIAFSLWAEKEYLSGRANMRNSVARRSKLKAHLAANREQFAQRISTYLV